MNKGELNLKVPTGIEGLDQILYGGFPEGSAILLEGLPGTGKTNFGMQFLYHGVQQYNEPGVYITFEELPNQIYKDMEAFGWNIRKLEQENKLKIICISPKILFEQMHKKDGLFEQIVKQLNCKRIVIDSISLFDIGEELEETRRKVIYTLRNILRKFGLTSLLIQEKTTDNSEQTSYVNFLVDGVIHISLSEFMNNYRRRTVEVLKMRGSNFIEGEHIYKITDQGIHVVPAFSMVEDKAIIKSDMISTGIPKLDELLSGGIPTSAAFIVDTNSKANFKYLVASIVTKRIFSGDRIVVLLSSLSSILDIEHVYRLYGIDLLSLAKEKKIYFIEHYDRPIPDGYEDCVIDVSKVNNEDYHKVINERLMTTVTESLNNGEHWFFYYDLNTVVSQRGKGFIFNFYAEEVAKINKTGLNILALCNFREVGVETASFLERTSNGVIRTWIDGSYQYLQLLKSPQGKMSQPFIVENIQTAPFIRLI